MSPRKRPRASPSNGSAPSSSSPAVPTPLPSQASTVSKASDVSADAVMSRSPTSSLAPSVAESAIKAGRYASLKESKNKTRSWYGSWPRAPKSAASTQVARETILADTPLPIAGPNLSRFDPRNASDAPPRDSSGSDATFLRARASNLSLGLAKYNTAPPQKENQEAGAPGLVAGSTAEPASLPTTHSTSARIEAGASDGGNAAAPAPAPAPAAEEMDTAADDGAPALAQGLAASPTVTPTAPPGWFSWARRRDLGETKLPVTEDVGANSPDLLKIEDSEVLPPLMQEEQPQGSLALLLPERPTTSGSMWTYFWPGGSRAANPRTDTPEMSMVAAAGPAIVTQAATRDVIMEDAPAEPISVPAASSAPNSQVAANLSVPAPATASAGSTWAFWSRDARKSVGKSPESVEQGELAVIGDRSEAHPKPAAGINVNEPPSSKASSMKDVPVKDGTPKDAGKSAMAESSKKSKRLRPKSMEIDDMASGPPPPQPEPQPLSKGSEASALKQPTTPAKGQPTAAKPLPPNLLLPSFRSTYRLRENPSIMRQIAQLLLRTQQPPANHVFLSKDVPKIKKAVAIGVHGLFPAAYLRPMIGQPTGTSIRFANHAAEAVRRWADSHNCEDCEIEKIALEGEGKIADRVENLWKLLLNWIDHIRSADLILLACHSQGVPVGFMLLAKLVDLGIVTTARIGVCAMAGVSLGPFPDYKSGLGILMGSASELWDFANPESEVSKRYEHALKTALNYGVRVAFVGSIDDQVVPLESAIYSPIHHPYVYRAVFVDGRIHAPDFIAHLVGFACKLRNLGVSDHGLIRELSVPLAGSLYSGEGHSRLYGEPQVYDLAVSHALETADVSNAVCEIRKHDGLTNPNPYHLPWVMRGLLEEDFVKTELHEETVELVKQYDEWKPVTKALKDVKYRLEAVRSKL